MAIGSILTKAVRRKGGNNKPQLFESPSSNSSKTNSSFKKGDSDSEATSFSSSVHGSTSSATSSSTDRHSSGVEGENRQKKTVDKLNSKKPTSTAFWPSRRRPKSQLMSLPDDGPATTHHPSPVQPSDASSHLQKPVQKFTRSGSLRSLKIVRKKNMSSSESKKSTINTDSHSKKATFSSILKDSKFPEQVEPRLHVKESEEVLSAGKVCAYEHCSLHGHHHHHEPPLKRFSYLKRRSSKDQKSINPQTRATNKPSVKKKEIAVTKKVSNECEKKKDVDFSIEFYAKTRPEPTFEPNCSRDDVHLANIMFGVNGDNQNENDSVCNNDNQISMWRLIHRHMVSGLIDQQLQDEKQSSCDDDDVANQGEDVQKMFAIKMVREAIEKIILPEEESSGKNQGDDQNEPNQSANDPFGMKKDRPNRWNHVKEVILMRRFITELENSNSKLDPDTCAHVSLVPEPEPEPEAEIVSLRSQTTGEKKESNEWMLDYALQQVVAELAPTQKRKVALLVKSFEMITPKLAKEVAV